MGGGLQQKDFRREFQSNRRGINNEGSNQDVGRKKLYSIRQKHAPVSRDTFVEQSDDDIGGKELGSSGEKYVLISRSYHAEKSPGCSREKTVCKPTIDAIQTTTHSELPILTFA